MQKRQTSLLVLVAAMVLFAVWRSSGFNEIDYDYLQEITQEKSSSTAEYRDRQFQYLIMFQQAGLALGLLIIPLGFVIHRNQKTLKRHRNTWKKAFQPPKKDNPRSLSQRLASNFPKLTHHDIQLCIMLTKGLSSKEIATKLLISPASVNTARYRLRKKLEIEAGTDLIKFLRKFDG